MIMMVREQDLAETIRKPIAKSEAQKVLGHIDEWDGAASEQWKTRANAQQVKLDEGEPFALAEVFKTLSMRREEDKLSAADRRQLSQVEQCLSEELAAAFGHTKRRALGKMNKAAQV